jgi:tetratricopeptide (TPR) repeat protein
VVSWTSEAKKLVEQGNEAAALELYRRAADELPGAPWLQQRTAELARRLRQAEVAISYFRRAANAFEMAGFQKRAVAPLRTAWSLSVDGLPASSATLVHLGVELVQLQKRLGYAADAAVTLERSNAALRGRGFGDIPSSALEAARSVARLPPTHNPSEPPGTHAAVPGAGASQWPVVARPSESPASEVQPRSSGSPSGSPSDRAQALARLLGRG